MVSVRGAVKTAPKVNRKYIIERHLIKNIG